MNIIDLINNKELAFAVADTAIQALAVSLIGFVILSVMRKRSAPVRSIIATGTLLAVIGVFICSLVFHTGNISWWRTELSQFKFNSKPAVVATSTVQTVSVNDPTDRILPEEQLIDNIPQAAMTKPTVPSKSKAAPIIAKTSPQLKVETAEIKITFPCIINSLGLLWLAGIIIMLFKLAYGLIFIHGFSFGLKRITDDKTLNLLRSMVEKFGNGKKPELYTSTSVESPLTVGIVKPIIIVPEKLFCSIKEDELKSLLLHELSHIYHRDHLMGIIKRLATALNWWNPLVHLICTKHTIAREEVADNYVLSEFSARQYSECLTTMAEKICLIGNLPSTAGMAGNYLSLEQRVKNILSKKRTISMKTGFFLKFIIIALFFGLGLAVAGVQGESGTKKTVAIKKLSAKEILSKTMEVYANCKTYEDHGEITRGFDNKGVTATFITSFVRPSDLRFEYSEKWKTYAPSFIVWNNKDKTKMWSHTTPNKISSKTSLKRAILARTASVIIPLLIPKLTECRMNRLRNIKLLKEKVFDNSLCYRLAGKAAPVDEKFIKDQVVIWIDKKTFLIRKAEEEINYKKIKTKGTAIYYPTVNQPIAKEKLEFNPPKDDNQGEIASFKPVASKPQLTAKNILDKMAKVYAECKTYKDHGVVKTVFIDDETRIVEKPFETCFVRPFDFRFEYSEKGLRPPCYIVWNNKTETKKWFYADKNKIKKEVSLSMAIAGATGVSGGSAHTIPNLLIDEIRGYGLKTLKKTKLLEEKRFDNSECYRIQGYCGPVRLKNGVTSKPLVVWIDKKTFLVRRIDEATEFPRFKTTTMTTYYPTINQPIAKEKLAFNPPVDGVTAPAVKQEKNATTGDYVITGTLPVAFSERKNAEGKIILYKQRTEPPITVEKIKTNAEGMFKLSVPGNKFDRKLLRAKVVFKSEIYAPLEAYMNVRPGKPVKAMFRPLVFKKDAVHYYGECLDEVTNKPIPYMGIYSDSRGTEIGRADKNGHFDFYTTPQFGRVHIIPWYSSTKYLGHSHFFTHSPGTSAELKIVIERGIRIRVKAVDEAGNPVSGVQINWRGAGSASGKTDKTGNVLLKGMVSRFRAGIISIKKKGYKLQEELSPIMAATYTDKPFVIVLHKINPSAKPKEKTLTTAERKAVMAKKELSKFTEEDMKELRILCLQYRKCKTNAERKLLIDAMIKKFPDSNIVASLIFKMAEKSSGKEQIELYQKVIDNFYNCYSDRGGLLGVQVMYQLGITYLKNGNEKKALECFNKVKQDYKKAVDKGKFLNLMEKVNYQLEYWASKQKELLDKKNYSPEARKEIQELFSSAVSQFDTPEGKVSLEKLATKYPEANATGMALLRWAGSSKGKNQIKYLQQAIKQSSDCYKYRVSVGALTRYLLARIYMKSGKRNEAKKLIKEIVTDYPNAIDSDQHKIAELALKLETPDQYIIPESDWQKLARLNDVISYQNMTGPSSDNENEEKAKLTNALIKGAYLARFKPINGFDPVIARQILKRLGRYSKKLHSGPGKIGAASIFRTAVVNGMLEGTFVTTKPELFKAVIKKSPSFELVSVEKATPDDFIKHIKSKQEVNEKKWKKLGPKIVEITPPNGAQKVDPGLKFIKIKFNQEMSRGGRAVVTLNPEKQIPVDGKIHWDKTGTTFIIPVKLEPNHEYLTSLNTAEFIGFFSKKGEPLAPYRYSFSTNSGK